MRIITTLIQVVLVSGTAWILFLLWTSRQTAGNSARVCPSCKVALGKFDLVHCGKCLENKQNPATEHQALNSGAVCEWCGGEIISEDCDNDLCNCSEFVCVECGNPAEVN